jgi:hypothetical protein
MTTTDASFNAQLADIQASVARLRHNSDKLINNLSSDLQDDFNSIITYINLLYGKEEYNQLYQIIKSFFGSLNKPKPGTIGAHFWGCFVAAENSSSPCSIICAGSVPPPPETGFPFCKYTVYTAFKQHNRYMFKKQYDAGTSDVILHMPESGQLSNEDIETLRSYGVNQIHPIFTDLQSSDNLDSIKFISLDQVNASLPLIELKPTIKSQLEQDNDWSWILLIAFLALIILLVVLFAYNQTSTSSTAWTPSTRDAYIRT